MNPSRANARLYEKDIPVENGRKKEKARGYHDGLIKAKVMRDDGIKRCGIDILMSDPIDQYCRGAGLLNISKVKSHLIAQGVAVNDRQVYILLRAIMIPQDEKLAGKGCVVEGRHPCSGVMEAVSSVQSKELFERLSEAINDGQAKEIARTWYRIKPITAMEANNSACGGDNLWVVPMYDMQLELGKTMGPFMSGSEFQGMDLFLRAEIWSADETTRELVQSGKAFFKDVNLAITGIPLAKAPDSDSDSDAGAGVDGHGYGYGDLDSDSDADCGYDGGYNPDLMS